MSESSANQHSGRQIEGPLLEEIREVALELRPGTAQHLAVTLDSSLDNDIGLDSLARMELLIRIERRFDLSLSESVFADANTPRELMAAILAADGHRSKRQLTDRSEANTRIVESAPDSAQTLVEVLRWHVERHPDQTHIRFYDDESDGDTLTYGDLYRGACEVAAGLQAQGFGSGDTAMIMLPTGAEYLFSFMGILLAGGVPVPIYPPARPSQVEDHLRRHATILENCRARTLITVPAARTVAQLLKMQVDSLRDVVTVSDLSGAADSFRPPVIDAADTGFIQYTSGSTGNPKGVVLSHANLVANLRAIRHGLDVDGSDVFVSWLPLYHDMGLIAAWLGSLYFGTQLVLMSPLDFLARPQRWLWAVHRFGGTVTAAPNFAFELCLRRLTDAELAGLDLGTLRLIANGAEAVSANTLRNFGERFAAQGLRPEALAPVYGLAENSVALAFPPMGRPLLVDRIDRERFTRDGIAVQLDDPAADALEVVSCGLPVRGHEVRVVSPGGSELPAGEEGRLQFRGPSATQGYYRNPEATKKLFDGDWLESGDLAYIRAGEIYITGRIKDVIIRAGRNIYPAEIEEAVGAIEGVRKGCVAVFGSADAGTERLVVVAETREQEAGRLGALRAEINAVAGELAGGAPDDVVLAPQNSVLKTSSGKIRRDASRQSYERGDLGRQAAPLWLQLTRVAVGSFSAQWRRLRKSVSAAAWAGWVYLLLLLLVPPTWLAIALLPTRGMRWGALRAALAMVFALAGLRPSIKHRERLPAAKAPVIYVCNHSSYIDVAVLIHLLPGQIGFIAKREFAEPPLTGIPLRRLGIEFVERFDKQRGVADARRIGGLAGRERPLLFFPEGTFVRTPGLLPFHMGAFAAAVDAGAAVVPLALRGTRSVLRDHSWLPRRGRLALEVCDSIHPRTIDADSDWSRAIKLRDRCREQILSRCGEPDLDGAAVALSRTDA